MKAVLLARDCALQDGAGESLHSGLKTLAQSDFFLILLDPCPGKVPAQRLAASVEAAGGRVDAVVTCPHPAGSGCSCWGTRPGLILEAATRFDLQLNECYLLCTKPLDIEMANAAGVRPILVLHGRTIGDLLGDRSTHKDYPVARELAQAVDYILAEERSTAQLGKPRLAAPPIAPEDSRRPIVGTPAITAVSRQATAANRRMRLRPREVGRWLAFLILGGVWLSLGIAYLLAQLYRVQPFPEVVWYLTLQFIPRVARGMLFILTGVAVLLLASRSFFRSIGNGNKPRN